MQNVDRDFQKLYWLMSRYVLDINSAARADHDNGAALAIIDGDRDVKLLSDRYFFFDQNSTD